MKPKYSLNNFLYIFLLCSFIINDLNLCKAEVDCFYLDSDGTFVSTKSRNDIPDKHLKNAKCTKVKKHSAKTTDIQQNYNYNKYKTIKETNNKKSFTKKDDSSIRPTKRVKPSNVELSQRSREKIISTKLGEVNLRWDAAAEKYFGDGIVGIVLSSFNAASRVLSKYSFPQELRIDNYNWQIVIMDKVPAGIDININGVGVCHPGWMRPPADIFIVGHRIASQCSRRLLPEKSALKSLSGTLTHEIGHAIEYSFLGYHYKLHQRWHKEGFATWFETLASRYLRYSGDKKNYMAKRVKRNWNNNWDPLSFTGSRADYSRGYAIIRTIADKRKVSGLQDVYKYARQNNIPIMNAVEKHLGWDQDKLSKTISHNFELQ